MFKDKNTVIGFALLAVLFFAYFFLTSKQSNEARIAKEKEQRRIDSINLANKKVSPADSIKNFTDSIDREKNKNITAAGSFASSINGVEQVTNFENEVIKIGFSNKGGRPAQIVLKNFKNYANNQVQLLGDSADKFGYGISNGINTGQLFFNLKSNTKNPDGSTSIVYEVKDSSGKSILHEYKLKPNSYTFDLNIQLQGANSLVTGNSLNLTDEVMVEQQDNDKSYETQSCHFTLLKDGDYDQYNAQSSRTFDVEKPVKWFGYKQRYFSSILLSNVDMKNTKVEIVQQQDSSKKLYLAKTNINIPLQTNGSAALQFYTGPNDYKLLDQLGQQTKNAVQLHSQPFGFVKWINRGLIMPVFNWLLKNIGSVGLAIALLTLFIRLLTAPLMIPSYRNTAKMKILRPEIDKLKEKFKDDQQGFAIEQMKFLKQAGVNQLQGCIPSLLQIPIFFALFALFTSHIGIRGENFLWAKDLSMYDSIVKFGFNIPLLGDHLSLFAITACITSFFISLYSMNSMPDQGNPVLKYMPYFFPIIMLFIFNKLPAALTWYYTVSNVLTLAIQYVINNYVINPEKLKVQIEESKKKVKPKSKFQERYEQMVETQKKAQQGKK